MGKRRDKIDIISEVLEASTNGIRKTQIMSRISMSFRQVNGYLAFMKDRELLQERNDGKPLYEPSEKGREFLRRYKEIKKYFA